MAQLVPPSDAWLARECARAARRARRHLGRRRRHPLAARQGRRARRLPARAPRRARSRSPSATSRASCASAAPASAGRRCATCPRRPPSPRSRSPTSTAPSRAIEAARRRRARRGARATQLAALFARATADEQRFLARAARRRAAPGRARGHRDRRGREGRRGPAGRGAPRGDARRRPRRRSPRRRWPRARPALAALRPAGRPPGRSRCSRRRAPTLDDGARAHRQRRGGRVEARRRRASRCTATATTSRVFTRTLDDVTERVPEVVEAVRALPVRSVILDGEAIALRPDGRPRPFQDTASRAASRGDVAALRAACR